MFYYLQETTHGIGDGSTGGMASGLSFRAIVELITTGNNSGLRSFLETQHANVDDKDEASRHVV